MYTTTVSSSGELEGVSNVVIERRLSVGVSRVTARTIGAFLEDRLKE